MEKYNYAGLVAHRAEYKALTAKGYGVQEGI
jgi:hypothetical protein